MEPVSGETKLPSTLVRLPDKQWVVMEDNKVRGLYPSEVKLAMLIQEQVISEWPKKS